MLHGEKNKVPGANTPEDGESGKNMVDEPSPDVLEEGPPWTDGCARYVAPTYRPACLSTVWREVSRGSSHTLRVQQT